MVFLQPSQFLRSRQEEEDHHYPKKMPRSPTIKPSKKPSEKPFKKPTSHKQNIDANEQNQTNDKASSKEMIVGIFVGTLALVIIIALAVYMYFQYAKKIKERMEKNIRLTDSV